MKEITTYVEAVEYLNTLFDLLNARFFDNDVSKVPKSAITMGSGTIMNKAKKIVLIATGANKADAIWGMVKGDKDINCPASVLQGHPDVVVIIDRAAAGRL